MHSCSTKTESITVQKYVKRGMVHSKQNKELNWNVQIKAEYIEVWTEIAQPSIIEGSSKNRRIPLWVTNTRYSLVKGERIIRFVFITRFRKYLCYRPFILWWKQFTCYYSTTRCGALFRNVTAGSKSVSLCLYFFVFVFPHISFFFRDNYSFWNTIGH